MHMSARVLWIWLASRHGVPARVTNMLLEQFGTPEQIYAADRDRLQQVMPLQQAHVDALCDKSLDEAQKIADTCEEQEITILTLTDSGYPERLRQIADPPLVLYVRGQLPDLDSNPGIAMVGTRKATAYGLIQAEHIARKLAKAGFVIVSGMAEGIDSAASRGALKEYGKTVVVLGCGVDRCYPMANRFLRDDILISGAVISEYPPGTPPIKQHFPVRNRIICGLCPVTVIVEAPKRSGALITARTAVEQGRDVFAVPGNIDAPNSQGTNRLIADGEAGLLCSADDVILEYGCMLRQPPEEVAHICALQKEIKKEPLVRTEIWQTKEKSIAETSKNIVLSKEVPEEPIHDKLENAAGEEKQILQAIFLGAGTIDEIAEQTSIETAQISAAITLLELDGWIVQKNGRFCLCNPS